MKQGGEAYDISMTELRTARLVLRRATPEDAEPMHDVMSDPRAMTYWSEGPHDSVERTREWIEATIAAPRSESDDFLVTLDGQAIGKMGAWRLPEFGFILAPQHWGKGYASEALAAFLDHIFERPDVDHLIADVDPRNRASLALLERHRFTETGRAKGTWDTHIGLCDSIYLRLDRATWKARQAGSRHQA